MIGFDIGTRNEVIRESTLNILTIPEQQYDNFIEAATSINTKRSGWRRYYGDYVIEHNYTNHEIQTHVILVVGILNDTVLFMDPAGKTKETILQYMQIEDFFDAYNGIHTIIEIS